MVVGHGWLVRTATEVMVLITDLQLEIAKPSESNAERPHAIKIKAVVEYHHTR